MSDVKIKLVLEIIKVVLIIIAGVWAYYKFIVQREKEPAADIDVDVRFVGIQDKKWIIEVTSLVENKSLVRLSYDKFQVTIRYLERGDEINDGKDHIHYQLDCLKTIDDRINENKKIADKDKKKRFFANVDYINPKQEFKHRYVTFVPITTSFIWVQCKFVFKQGKQTKMSTQRIFYVPVNDEK